MILQALTDYYERLAQDPEQDVAPFGYSRQKVSFAIVINLDGTLVQFSDWRSSDDGKPRPQMLTLPGQSKPSGQGINPCFLWDQSAYLLGFKADDPKPERTRQAFEAFRDRHLALESKINDPHFSAVCRFLQSWSPGDCAKHAETLAEIAIAFGVFRINGETAFVHQRPAIERYWTAQIGATESDCVAPSLIDGEPQPLARLHEPKIKNVSGAQSSGAAIVSFNLDAFESYGKSQSYNAPVGVRDAFRYATALNRLTGDDARRVRMADTTLVFWSERPTAFEEGLPAFFDEYLDRSAEDDTQVSQVKQFFSRLVTGRAANAEEAAVPFYVLGLSPNAARLSVRAWLTSTVGEFSERLAQHVRDLAIAGPLDPSGFSVRRLVLETATPKNGWPDEESVSPLLAGQFLQSVIEGRPYPEALLPAILARVRAEAFADERFRKDWRDAQHRRAAILKAFLIRNRSIPMDVYLNKIHPEKAYHCGRLFAVLAFTQEQALPQSRVVRRNLGSAMATPGLMLGLLQKNAEVGHLPKLHELLAEFVRDELKGINVMLRDSLPKTLSLAEQGTFALGFYQEARYLDCIEDERRGGSRRVRTSQGDWVRSNLERRVADCLAKAKVIYIYEVTAVLNAGSERWPDFYVKHNDPAKDLYIEVLGMDTPEYNARWDEKLRAYSEYGVTPGGGRRGRLVVLDFRTVPYDDVTVLRALNIEPTQADD